MANPQVPVTATAIDNITPKAADGSQQALKSLALTIDDYATAYVAPYPAAGTDGFIVVPKNSSQVGTKTVTVTAHANDLAGDPLPLATQSYDIVGAPPPPLATQVVFGSPTVGAFAGVPADPGSSSVTLI